MGEINAKNPVYECGLPDILRLLFFAAKTILTIALPGLLVLYGVISSSKIDQNAFSIADRAGRQLATFCPTLLAQQITYRKREIFENFRINRSDDRFCVEAGLGLDAAIGRVGEEMRLTSPILADELHLVGRTTRRRHAVCGTSETWPCVLEWRKSTHWRPC